MSDAIITKKAIIEAFKNLMREKAFDKISISDITNYCGLNRQSFYYHFEDKYDLLNYIYYHQIFLPLVEDLDTNHYYHAFLAMFDKMKKEQQFYINALHMNAEYGFREYLLAIFEQLIAIILTGVDAKKASLITRFNAYGLWGVITDWIESGMDEQPSVMAHKINDILINLKKTL